MNKDESVKSFSQMAREEALAEQQRDEERRAFKARKYAIERVMTAQRTGGGQSRAAAHEGEKEAKLRRTRKRAKLAKAQRQKTGHR